MIPISPMQGACVSLLTINAALLPLTQLLLVPGTFFRTFVKEFYQCSTGAGCKPAALVDFKALWRTCDVQHLGPIFQHAFKVRKCWRYRFSHLLAVLLHAVCPLRPLATDASEHRTPVAWCSIHCHPAALHPAGPLCPSLAGQSRDFTDCLWLGGYLHCHPAALSCCLAPAFVPCRLVS